ncbi:putative Polyprotein [Phytophthora cinnamomi]|uniref:putative Polyprotein n=1 Tax=Phytophthora cinnamomi TaxID=4785 RepID=UPI0035596432|nr:putative Polyprotein [Phytophthora cinnamomi]
MNDTSMNDASTLGGATGMSLEHASFPHLSLFEWEALHRLAAVSGDGVVKTLLTAGTEQQQRLAAQEFMARELADLRQRATTLTSTKNKTDIVKLDVSTYSGEGKGRLHLNRWFCEVDIAIEARQLSTELARTRFLLSKLAGNAKEWALGKLVADASCFPTMASMKADLRLAFEPPQDESVQRSTFLSLKQGHMSMLEYIQRARHLVSCITSHPVDMATQVHVFISGMNAGYQRFYLTRKTPSTLEEAFAVALREDYSVTASQAFDVSRDPAPEPEPMEVDAIQHYGGRRGPTSSSRATPSPSTRSPRPMLCFRCGKPGHRAAVCRAPSPMQANVTIANDVAAPKNGDNQ